MVRRLGPSLLALASGVVLADYFFIEPPSRCSLPIWTTRSALVFHHRGRVMAVLSESLHASRRKTETALAQLAEANRSLQRKSPSGNRPNNGCWKANTASAGTSSKDWSAWPCCRRNAIGSRPIGASAKCSAMRKWSCSASAGATWFTPTTRPGKDAAFQADAGRSRSGLRHESTLRPQGRQDPLREPLRAVHAETGRRRRLHPGLGPGPCPTATAGGCLGAPSVTSGATSESAQVKSLRVHFPTLPRRCRLFPDERRNLRVFSQDYYRRRNSY